MSEHKSKKITRRDALTASLTHAGAVTLAGTVLSSPIARTAHAAGDETIKVALVGCGARGTGAASQALKTKGPMKLWAMAANRHIGPDIEQLGGEFVDEPVIVQGSLVTSRGWTDLHHFMPQFLEVLAGK